jgi:ribosomal protein L20A (L18A)
MSEEIIKKEGKSAYFWIKVFAITIVSLTWITLIGLKLSTDISLKTPLWISVAITILGIFAWIGQYFAQKKSDEPIEQKKLNPITKEEAKDMVYRIVEDRWDHILRPESVGIPEVTTETVQGSQIYTFRVNLLYGDSVYIIIDATHPEVLPTIVPVEETKNPTRNRLVNVKSQNPKEEPDVIEETINDDLSGRTKTTRKQIHAKKQEETKKEEEIA